MLDGRTNRLESIFEALFKGVGTRFGRRPFEKWFPRAEHGNMQLRNLSSNLQLRDLRQCDYLANYKIYITDSVVVCCTGSETRPILCSVFQNLRLGTHIMTTVLRKNHSPGSVLRVSTRFVGRVACGRKCGRWRRRTSPSCTKNRKRLAEIDLHDKDEAFFIVVRLREFYDHRRHY